VNMGWLGFIVDGLLIALAVWISQRRKIRPLWRLLSVALVVCALGFLLYLQETPKTLGGSTPWYRRESVQDAGLFVLMLLGMAARYFTRAIEVRREKIAALAKAGDQFKKPGLEFDMWEFSYPLFVSVITFGVLLSQLSVQVITITSAVLSFQTGFFWQTLLAAKQKTDG
jgi:hypothetical protein